MDRSLIPSLVPGAMRVFQHADLEIDPSRGEIRRLGAVLPVESKVLDLVFLLIEAGGRTAGYAEIRERLWPGVHVSRDAVYRVVKEARALLGDDGRRQAVIRTLPGRGVRWVAPVEVREEAHAGIERPGLDAIQALYESGRISAAREQAMLLARLTEGPEHVARRARALIWASDLMLHGRVDREWLTLSRDTLQELPPEDGRPRAELLARQAYQLYWSRDATRSREALREARELAEGLDAAEVLAWTELIEHMLLEGPERAAGRRAHAERAVAFARRAGAAQIEQWAREQLAHEAMEVGELAVVDAEAAAIELLAEEHSLVWPGRVRTLLQLHFGDLPAAERALLRELGRFEPGDAHAFQYLGGPLLWLRLEQGRLAEALPLLRRFVTKGAELPVWRAALARGELEAGEIDAARAEYDGLAAGGFRDVDGHFVSPVTLAHLAELCVGFEDRARASWLWDRLAPYGGRLIVSPRASFSLGPADLIRGRLAALLGRARDARACLEQARALAERTSSRPARERCDRALARLVSAS